MRAFERVILVFNLVLAWAAGVGLVVMMLTTVGDMILRSSGRPLAGSYEVIGWLAAACTALALGYTQHHKGHVSIDLFVGRLSPRAQAALQAVVDLLSAGLFAAVTWRVFLYAGILRESGSLSETLRVAVYPWVYLVALGCGGLTLALLVDVGKSLRAACGGNVRHP